jgi:hypothetical protein
MLVVAWHVVAWHVVAWLVVAWLVVAWLVVAWLIVRLPWTRGLYQLYFSRPDQWNNGIK